MSPTYSPLLAPSRPRLQINQSTTIPRRLTVVLSFSMCIFSEKWSILVSVSFLYLQTANWASKLFFFFCFTNRDVESVATVPVYVKTAVLLGISFFSC